MKAMTLGRLWHWVDAGVVPFFNALGWPNKSSYVINRSDWTHFHCSQFGPHAINKLLSFVCVALNLPVSRKTLAWHLELDLCGMNNPYDRTSLWWGVAHPQRATRTLIETHSPPVVLSPYVYVNHLSSPGGIPDLWITSARSPSSTGTRWGCTFSPSSQKNIRPMWPIPACILRHCPLLNNSPWPSRVPANIPACFGTVVLVEDDMFVSGLRYLSPCLVDSSL